MAVLDWLAALAHSPDQLFPLVAGRLQVRCGVTVYVDPEGEKGHMTSSSALILIVCARYRDRTERARQELDEEFEETKADGNT